MNEADDQVNELKWEEMAFIKTKGEIVFFVIFGQIFSGFFPPLLFFVDGIIVCLHLKPVLEMQFDKPLNFLVSVLGKFADEPREGRSIGLMLEMFEQTSNRRNDVFYIRTCQLYV